MDWIQVLTIAGTNIAMFVSMVGLLLWFRSEARQDWKYLDEKVDANHRETLCIIESIRKETLSITDAIRQDIKDFHGRLCAIEERRKGS